MTAAIIPLITKVSADHYETALLLGMGDIHAGILHLLNAGLKRTPPPAILRRNLTIYHEHKVKLTPKPAICDAYQITPAYLNKIIRDCEELEQEKGTNTLGEDY